MGNSKKPRASEQRYGDGAMNDRDAAVMSR
jgi:hypothetical protein